MSDEVARSTCFRLNGFKSYYKFTREKKKTNWGVFLELPDYVMLKPSIYHFSIVMTSTKFFSVNFAPNRSFKMA